MPGRWPCTRHEHKEGWSSLDRKMDVQGRNRGTQCRPARHSIGRHLPPFPCPVDAILKYVLKYLKNVRALYGGLVPASA